MILLIGQLNPRHRSKYIGTIGILTKHNPIHSTAVLKHLQHVLVLDCSDYPIKHFNMRVLVYGKLFVLKKGHELLFRLKVYHIEPSLVSHHKIHEIGKYCLN
eukprot:NODE_71_length_23666_cov_0.239403.p16 type:complete len:102 gc:universal NODE_71_length_23666_cov_0.239403:16315-16620(+)